MKRALHSGLAIASCVALGLTGFAGLGTAQAAPALQSANGQGTLDDGARHFAFNAKRSADGTVTGHVTLINRNFSGDSGHGPYRLHGDISCMTVTGNVATFGGTVKRTNDSNLVDAFYFRVADFGEPGAGKDQISRVAFYDDDPSTEGDPALCLNEDTANYTPLEPIESGNIQVRPVG
jgi:hypothetical protein